MINNDLQVAVEYRYITENKTIINGVFCSHTTLQGQIVFDENMAFDQKEVHDAVSDKETRDEIKRVYDQWCQDFIPINANKKVERSALKQKLESSLTEIKRKYREELKRRNGAWVSARVHIQALGKNIQNPYNKIASL